jgi:hypothetical protein
MTNSGVHIVYKMVQVRYEAQKSGGIKPAALVLLQFEKG